MTQAGAPAPALREGLPTEALGVLEFWLGDALSLGWPSQSRSALWFGGGAARDLEIRQRFGPLVQQAVGGALARWEPVPLARLALVLLLDQFTRNVFRGQATAFSGDARAQALVLGDGAGRQANGTSLPLAGEVFMCLPLMHAENLALQDLCVRRLQALRDHAAPALHGVLQGHINAALEHRDIIARFGRFPYRNQVLDRASTPAEEQFLLDGKRFGQ